MPHKKREFENNEVYHITLRRVADQPLFLDEDDNFRGIYSVYEFNNSNPVIIRKRRGERKRFKKNLIKISDRGLPPATFAGFAGGRPLQKTGPLGLVQAVSLPVLPVSDFPASLTPTPSELSVSRGAGENMGATELKEPDRRVKLVETLAFCLMPNHLHLLLRQVVKAGISKYMQKLGSGLAAHFFEKYFSNTEKRGHFFQDRFHATPILDSEQLQNAFVYIHTNPLSIIEPKWKEKGIKNAERAINFLEEKYRWSSYFDYWGKKNFSSIIEKEKDFLTNAMGGQACLKKQVRDWVYGHEVIK